MTASTPPLGIDYAWQHPNPAAIAAAGYSFVVRYLSHDPSKNLTREEAKALHAAGLDILLVWESTANRAGQGVDAGLEDAHDADAAAGALGLPTNVPIFYAVDYDATAAEVAPYFKAIHASSNYPFGAYGGIKITQARLAPFNWQTVAWSGGRVDPKANLYQRIKPTRPLGGGGFDEDVLLNGVPMWLHRKARPKPVPKPPAPKGQPVKTVGTWNMERGRSHADVAHDLDSIIPAADVWLLQENFYAPVLQAAADRHGYALLSFTDKPEQGESPILVRKGIRVTHAAPVALSSHGWFTVRGGKVPPKWGTVATADGINLESVHLPPTVQSAVKRRLAPRRWAAYRQIMRRLSGQTFGPEVVVGGDWNVDARTDRVKGGVKWFPARVFARIGLARAFPRAATHGGGRVIDGFGVKGLTVTTRVLDEGHSDHRPVVATITRRNA